MILIFQFFLSATYKDEESLKWRNKIRDYNNKKERP